MVGICMRLRRVGRRAVLHAASRVCPPRSLYMTVASDVPDDTAPHAKEESTPKASIQHVSSSHYRVDFCWCACIRSFCTGDALSLRQLKAAHDEAAKPDPQHLPLSWFAFDGRCELPQRCAMHSRLGMTRVLCLRPVVRLSEYALPYDSCGGSQMSPKLSPVSYQRLPLK